MEAPLGRRLPLRRGADPGHQAALACRRLPLHGLPDDERERLLAVAGHSRRRLRGDRGRAGPRRPQPRHASFLPGCMTWMFTRPIGMDWFVNLRPSLLDDHGWFVPFIETWTERETALGGDRGEAQLRDRARSARVRAADRRICRGGRAARLRRRPGPASAACRASPIISPPSSGDRGAGPEQDRAGAERRGTSRARSAPRPSRAAERGCASSASIRLNG